MLGAMLLTYLHHLLLPLVTRSEHACIDTAVCCNSMRLFWHLSQQFEAQAVLHESNSMPLRRQAMVGDKLHGQSDKSGSKG